ncbi:hypothetical protein IOD13_11610 [Brevibacterium casei]|nr:hypothetical protein [Brevibacterium casei]
MSRTTAAKMNSTTAVPESARSAALSTTSVTVDVLDEGPSAQLPHLGGPPESDDRRGVRTLTSTISTPSRLSEATVIFSAYRPPRDVVMSSAVSRLRRSRSGRRARPAWLRRWPNR